MGIEGNKATDQAEKEAVELDQFLAIRRVNLKYQKRWESSTFKLHNIKPRIEEKESTHNSLRQYKMKLISFHNGHRRLINGHSCQHLIYRNPSCAKPDIDS